MRGGGFEPPIYTVYSRIISVSVRRSLFQYIKKVVIPLDHPRELKYNNSILG